MAKSDITFESAKAVIDRVVQELGLLTDTKSNFLKVQGPTNKHRIYIQKSRNLGRIDFTIDLPQDDPAWKQLGSPNGSVKCHIIPDLVQLERCLRMLGDSALGVQVPNKPRPFAASKQQTRRPKAVATPVPTEALIPVEEETGPKREFKDRVAAIRTRARASRINMILENPDKYGDMSEAEAAQLVDDKVDLTELASEYRARASTELSDTLAEAGIEVTQ